MLRGERGIALLIVVSVLTVIGIMGVAFAYSMFLETQSTRDFVVTTQARYLAESGVRHGWVLLDEDAVGSLTDDRTERWAQVPSGNEADVDGDGITESRWWTVESAAGEDVGRYAMQITDEGAKVNLHAAQAEPPAFGVGGINVTALLTSLGWEGAGETARMIDVYRYGADGQPGVALHDDDHDGAVDELDEYQPLALIGDDRRFEGMEDVATIAHLEAEQMAQLSRVATVYSWDVNASVAGTARVNVNAATAEQLLTVLFDAGVEDPWQVAVNMADFVDADFQMSTVHRVSTERLLDSEGPLGSWTWMAGNPGAYRSGEPGAAALSWSPAISAGTYGVLARGLEGAPVGDVTIAGQLMPSVWSGDSLGTLTFAGGAGVTVTIACPHEPAGACAFRGFELVPEETLPGQGTLVRGIEGLRINELMVDPRLALEAATATFDPQGSDWSCQPLSGLCTNSGVGQARWVWVSSVVAPGRYYIRVYGQETAQVVGQVRVETTTVLLSHGQTHPAPILVGSDGKITVTIGKTEGGGTYYLKGLELTLQPDAEYVELVNLTEQPVDISGWTLEGLAAGGRVAQFPWGTVAPARGYLVAAVDLSDGQAGLAGNGIDARTSWDIPEESAAVQLEFPEGGPSPEDDWLKTTMPDGQAARLVLRTGDGWTVDEVVYPLPLPTTAGFQSVEKGDPTVVSDADKDGMDDGWYPSLTLYTPGALNDNEGMREQVGLELVLHDPAEETSVANRPLSGIGELAGLPSGEAWTVFASTDLAKMVDRFTVEGLRLETEGALETGSDAWEEKAEGAYVHTDPDLAAVAARWRWTGIIDGTYDASLYGTPGEQMAVRWERADGSYSEWSPALSTDSRGRLVIGQMTIGGTESPPGALVLEARCATVSGICHVDYARLDPLLFRVGPVNVNTAPLEVLRALPGVTDAVASRLIAGRPYGNQDERGRGVGDLLMGDVLGATEEDKLAVFRQLGHLVTTRSDMFQITGFGQALDGGHVTGAQRVRSVIQRQRSSDQ